MGEVTRTPNPPVLVEREGTWWIEIMLEGGQDVVLASVGDGSWLYQQIVEKLVLPRLRQDVLAGRFVSDPPNPNGQFVSPND